MAINISTIQADIWQAEERLRKIQADIWQAEERLRKIQVDIRGAKITLL